MSSPFDPDEGPSPLLRVLDRIRRDERTAITIPGTGYSWQLELHPMQRRWWDLDTTDKEALTRYLLRARFALTIATELDLFPPFTEIAELTDEQVDQAMVALDAGAGDDHRWRRGLDGPVAFTLLVLNWGDLPGLSAAEAIGEWCRSFAFGYLAFLHPLEAIEQILGSWGGGKSIRGGEQLRRYLEDHGGIPRPIRGRVSGGENVIPREIAQRFVRRHGPQEMSRRRVDLDRPAATAVVGDIVFYEGEPYELMSRYLVGTGSSAIEVDVELRTLTESERRELRRELGAMTFRGGSSDILHWYHREALAEFTDAAQNARTAMTHLTGGMAEFRTRAEELGVMLEPPNTGEPVLIMPRGEIEIDGQTYPVIAAEMHLGPRCRCIVADGETVDCSPCPEHRGSLVRSSGCDCDRDSHGRTIRRADCRAEH